jgi:hypothetical protein
MKITPKDYATLHMAITMVRAAGSMPEFPAYQAQGLSHRRWRWDLLWYAKKVRLPHRFIEDTLYSYCNDDHIDTALRRIVQ